MASMFADMMTSNWPVMLGTHGEDAVYLAADGTETALTVVVTGKPESLSLDDTFEMATRQIEILAAISESPAAFAIREDSITVRGQTYTVLERSDGEGALYKYLCERVEVNSVGGPGRRY